MRRVKKRPPFEFVLEALSEAEPRTRAMFGCTAVYLGDRITFILRDRENHREDNGIWFATTSEHHSSLSRDFPTLRSIQLFQAEPGQATGWQVLPAEADGFEADALKACRMALRGDPRIGKVPASKSARARMKPAQKREASKVRRRGGSRATKPKARGTRKS